MAAASSRWVSRLASASQGRLHYGWSVDPPQLNSGALGILQANSLSDNLPSRATELAADLLEPGIDALMSSGVLREIPLLGSVVKLANAGRAIADRILLAKLLRFVQGVEDVSDDERREFAYRMKTDDNFRERVGESVLLAIDKVDDLDKPAILARALRALVRRKIELAAFRRLTSAITTGYSADLHDLVESGNEQADDRTELFRRLVPTGLTGFPRSAGGMQVDTVTSRQSRWSPK